MHCKAHQTGKPQPEIGNQLADKAAKEDVETGIVALLPEKEITLLETPPKYDSKDAKLIKASQAQEQTDGWAVTPTGQIIIPPSLMREIAK